MNEQIVGRIKKARIERGYTQKDLGNHLGRSAASISELERGNVQVNAADLYDIANFFNKPMYIFTVRNMVKKIYMI